METTITIKKEELTIDFLNYLKKLYKNSRLLQISISDVEHFDLLKTETKEDYFERLEKAIKDVETKKVTFTEEEFETLTKQNL
jgi:hypothetical protein